MFYHSVKSSSPVCAPASYNEHDTQNRSEARREPVSFLLLLRLFSSPLLHISGKKVELLAINTMDLNLSGVLGVPKGGSPSSDGKKPAGLNRLDFSQLGNTGTSVYGDPPKSSRGRASPYQTPNKIDKVEEKSEEKSPPETVSGIVVSPRSGGTSATVVTQSTSSGLKSLKKMVQSEKAERKRMESELKALKKYIKSILGKNGSASSSGSVALGATKLEAEALSKQLEQMQADVNSLSRQQQAQRLAAIDRSRSADGQMRFELLKKRKSFNLPDLNQAQFRRELIEELCALKEELTSSTSSFQLNVDQSVAAVTSRMSGMENAFGDFNARAVDLSCKMDKNQALTSKVGLLTHELSQLKQVSDGNKGAVSSVKNRVEALSMDAEQQKSQMEERKSEVELLRAENRKLESHLEETQNQCVNHTQTIHHMTDRLASLESTVQALTSCVETLTSRVEEIPAEAIASLQDSSVNRGATATSEEETELSDVVESGIGTDAVEVNVNESGNEAVGATTGGEGVSIEVVEETVERAKEALRLFISEQGMTISENIERIEKKVESVQRDAKKTSAGHKQNKTNLQEAMNQMSSLSKKVEDQKTQLESLEEMVVLHSSATTTGRRSSTKSKRDSLKNSSSSKGVDSERLSALEKRVKKVEQQAAAPRFLHDAESRKESDDEVEDEDEDEEEENSTFALLQSFHSKLYGVEQFLKEDDEDDEDDELDDVNKGGKKSGMDNQYVVAIADLKERVEALSESVEGEEEKRREDTNKVNRVSNEVSEAISRLQSFEEQMKTIQEAQSMSSLRGGQQAMSINLLENKVSECLAHTDFLFHHLDVEKQVVGSSSASSSASSSSSSCTTSSSSSVGGGSAAGGGGGGATRSTSSTTSHGRTSPSKKVVIPQLPIGRAAMHRRGSNTSTASK